MAAQAPPPCSSFLSGCNLLTNPSFEQTVNSACPQGISTVGYRAASGNDSSSINYTTTQLRPQPSLVCDWFSGNVSGTPDLFNACATDPANTLYHSVSVPCNFATVCTVAGQAAPGQPAITGQGYAGLIGFVPQTSATPNDADDYREYLAHQISPALVANQAYYVGYRANIAPMSGRAIPYLGLAFTTRPALAPPSRIAYAGSGRIPLAAVASSPVASVPLPGWNRVQGVYTATGAETQLLIGNFGPGYGPAPGYAAPAYSQGPGATATNPRFPELLTAAYYFVEDVVVQPMPTAGPDHTVVCGEKVKLGAGCALPAQAGATYAWSPSAGLSNPNALFTLLAAGNFSAAQYTLTITLPNGALPPIVYTSTTHLYGLPTAGPSLIGACGSRLALGDNCSLPVTPGTQYVWSPTTDLIGDRLLGLNIPNPTLLVGPNTAPTYTLTVSTPYLLPNGTTAYTITTSTVNIAVTGSPAPLSISTAQNVPLCAGSTLALTASGGDGSNYSWSSPQLPGFTATGQSVTVNLVAGAMTFVLTSTTCGATALNLNVQAKCCLIEEYRERMVEITEIGGLYNASTGSPFNRGPGAIYHVARHTQLHDLLYTLEPGVKLLIEGNVIIELDNQAGLRMNGATLTAACEEMWNTLGTWTDNTRGIITYDLTNPAATLYSTIEHSRNGVQIRASGGASFGISHVHFRQNYYSLSIDNWFGQNQGNGMVTYCTFDSDSSAMKFPREYRNENDYFHSQEHVSFSGDVRGIAWDHNQFNHAMVGVMVYRWFGWVNLVENEFRNCYWAGVALGDIPYTAWNAPGNTAEITLTRNHFYLPVYQPSTFQRTYLYRNMGYAKRFVNQCYGALLPFVKLEAYNNTFEQAGTYSPTQFDYNFDTRRPVPDIGLRANLLYAAKDNTFARLGHGMQLSLAADAPVSVLGNTFRDCQVGIGVDTRRDRQPNNMDPSQSGRPELFNSCNTFDPDPNRRDTSTGIVVEDSPGAPPLAFENFDGQAANAIYPLKDLFLDNGRPQGEFVTINNRGNNLIRYKTFTRQSTEYQGFKIGQVVFDDLGGNVDNATVQFQSCTQDGFPFTGVQPRPGHTSPPTTSKAVARLAQNVPNPCTGSTTLDYELPPNTRQATITVRRGLDGVFVEQITLKPSASQYLLDLRRYAPGLYFYSLTADDLPVQTKRMLVE